MRLAVRSRVSIRRAVHHVVLHRVTAFTHGRDASHYADEGRAIQRDEWRE